MSRRLETAYLEFWYNCRSPINWLVLRENFLLYCRYHWLQLLVLPWCYSTSVWTS